MLTKKQLEIIDIFRKNLGKKMTFEQLKREAKIKSHSLLQRALGKSLKEGVLTTEPVGKSLLYSLEINPVTARYLGSIGKELYNLPISLLDDIVAEISKKTTFFIGVVFGSYAQNKQIKGSDLDIAIIVADKKTIKLIEPLLESIKRKELKKLDTHIFSQREFTDMLSIEKENVGKQILINHLVFYNSDSFYQTIKPWIHL